VVEREPLRTGPNRSSTTTRLVQELMRAVQDRAHRARLDQARIESKEQRP
jgi:hypothetical protein